LVLGHRSTEGVKVKRWAVARLRKVGPDWKRLAARLVARLWRGAACYHVAPLRKERRGGAALRSIDITLARLALVVVAGACFTSSCADVQDRVATEHRYSIEIRAGDWYYLVDKGGAVDFGNAATRLYDDLQLAALTDLSLEIENLGIQDLRDPKIVVNGQRDWWDNPGILREALAGADQPLERVLAVWDFLRLHRYHDIPLFEIEGGKDLHAPAKLLASYGAGLCDDVARASVSLYADAVGKRARQGQKVLMRRMFGHMMSEFPLDGTPRFLDPDRGVFYLDRAASELVGGDAVRRDHDLARREHHFGPGPQPAQGGEQAASLFGADDRLVPARTERASLHLKLRPGESVTYLFTRTGEFPARSPDVTRKVAANARFRVDAARGTLPLLVEAGADVDWLDQLPFAGTTRTALHLPIELPHPIAGGEVEAHFWLDAGGEAEVALSRNGGAWTVLCELHDPGAQACRVELAQSLEVKAAPPKYSYRIRVALRQARVTALRVDTTTLVSLFALPHLALGRNEVRYTDRSEGPRRVRVTHRWREVQAEVPPAPRPISPPTEEPVAADQINFQWEDVAGASLYHFRLARGPHFRFPFRPSFDRYVELPALTSSTWGMFRPDEPYLWTVRARGADGVWGPWSEARAFRWQGPMAPLDLTLEPRDDELTLTWRSSPEGERPVSFEVYASDERGFTPSLVAREVLGRGTVPSDLVARVEGTELVAVTSRPRYAGQNRCFWRVVAIDARGVRSAPSDYAEAPHPMLVAPARVVAAIGEEVRIPFWTISSLGDLQFGADRGAGFSYRDAEQVVLEIADAPDWLERDDRGLLGRAPVGVRGERQITLTARTKAWREQRSVTLELLGGR